MPGGTNGTGNGPRKTPERVTRWEVVAPGPQTEPDRSRFHGWLNLHGIDPRWCMAVEIDVLDVPFVRAECFMPNGEGRKSFDATTGQFRTCIREMILLENPPVMEGTPIWEPKR